MALRRAFTELFSLRHPIALAPMGGASGDAQAAAELVGALAAQAEEALARAANP